MSHSAFHRVVGFVFAVVALGHAARAVLALPAQVGSMAIPLWASWAGAAVAGALSVWSFRSRDLP